ncbi:MAG TPA: hypothetical protein VHX63_07675 [Acidobacteriaceae bacterium]|jgi:hypothetical protein|nr:hypothetical protein [Acidobacteriaceae bacterium]
MTNEGFTIPAPTANPYGPLTPTELLQRIFAMYRENPKTMFGLMLIVAAVELVTTAILTGSTAIFVLPEGGRMAPLQALFFACIALMTWLLIYVVSQVVHGAYFYAVTAQVQRRPMRVGEAASLALEHIERLISVSVQVFLRVLGYMILIEIIFAVIGGLIAAGLFVAFHGAMGSVHAGHWMAYALILVPLLAFGFLLFLVAMLWVYARYAVAIPACMAESLPGSVAIRRSITLSMKSHSRIYAMYIFCVVLGMASAAILFPMMLLSMHHGGHTMFFQLVNAIASAVNLLFGAWLLSFIGIGATLCYYDLRVRKEGFGAAVAQAETLPETTPPVVLPPDLSTGDLPMS